MTLQEFFKEISEPTYFGVSEMVLSGFILFILTLIFFIASNKASKSLVLLMATFVVAYIADFQIYKDKYFKEATQEIISSHHLKEIAEEDPILVSFIEKELLNSWNSKEEREKLLVVAKEVNKTYYRNGENYFPNKKIFEPTGRGTPAILKQSFKLEDLEKIKNEKNFTYAKKQILMIIQDIKADGLIYIYEMKYLLNYIRVNIQGGYDFNNPNKEKLYYEYTPMKKPSEYNILKSIL